MWTHSASKLRGGRCEPTVPRGEVESWAGPASLSLFPAPSPERPVPSYLVLLHTLTGQGHLGGGISCPQATSWTAMPNRKGCLHLYLTLMATQLSTMGKHSGCRALVSPALFQTAKVWHWGTTVDPRMNECRKKEEMRRGCPWYKSNNIFPVFPFLLINGYCSQIRRQGWGGCSGGNANDLMITSSIQSPRPLPLRVWGLRKNAWHCTS